MDSILKKYCLKLKRNIFSIIFLMFTILLVLFSKSNLASARDGLILWATCVIPSLFPFFVATELLSYTNIISIFSRLLNKYMRPIFNVPGCGAFAFILGLISGYPVGAKAVCNLRENGYCTKSEGNRLLCFTNNSGPLFILGTIGTSFYKNSTIGYLLLTTHILSCITVGILLGLHDRYLKNLIRTKRNLSIDSNSKSTKHIVTCSSANFGEVLGMSINNAISTTLMIGGFVVLFSVILSIIENSNTIDFLCNTLSFLPFDKTFISNFIMGIIELTNGSRQICTLNTKCITKSIVACSFLLGFGGLSVLLQVSSIISKTDLSIKSYFKGKILQGVIAAFYTYSAIMFFPFLKFDL